MQTLVRAAVCGAVAWGAGQIAAAQTPETAAPVSRTTAAVPAVEAPASDVLGWLQRMNTAARQRAYAGTFVVSVPGGNLSSAKIWHACEGNVQMERVEALSGPPRSIFRRNHEIVTFLPDLRIVRRGTRQDTDFFHNLPNAPDSSIAEHYGVQFVGRSRVAGFEADVVQLIPRDGLRFGYRVWSERNSGMLMKRQTLDTEGRVVEQAAFSELQLDTPIKMRTLMQMMRSVEGYRIEESQLARTSAQAQGWTLTSPVAGFKPVGSYLQSIGGEAAQQSTMQWIFSDGLASVSLFVEPYDARRTSDETLFAFGSTNTLTRRISSKDGDWWLSAVGEVPPQTLQAFAQRLVRTH